MNKGMRNRNGNPGNTKFHESVYQMLDVANHGMPTTAGDYLGLYKPPERPEPVRSIGYGESRREIDDDARGLANDTDRMRLSGGTKFIGGLRLTAVRRAPVVMCVHLNFGPCVLDDPCDSCLPGTVNVICTEGEVRVERGEFLGALRREPPTWKDAVMLNKLYVEWRVVPLHDGMYPRRSDASRTDHHETAQKKMQRVVDEQTRWEKDRLRELVEGPKVSKLLWRNPASAEISKVSSALWSAHRATDDPLA